MIRITYFGHSMWKLETEQTGLVLDPFSNIGYPMPENLYADIVCSSHNHYDHNHFSLIHGHFEKLINAGQYQIGDFNIEGFKAFHDEVHGEKRGDNILFRVSAEGLNFLHCGDLGHVLTPEMIESIGKIDVLMIPVGGTYTLDYKEAKVLCDQLNPKIIFPMHYKTDCVNISISDYKGFCSLFEKIVYLSGNAVTTDDLDFVKQGVYIFNL